MTILESKNDLTTVTNGIIAHCVNCQGAMGSGVARALFLKWPEVREWYMEMPTGRAMLGTWHQVFPASHPNVIIANIYGQEFCGGEAKFGVKYADIDSVRRGLLPVFDLALTTGKTLYLPKIASDLAGLDWEKETFPMIKALDIAFDLAVNVEIYHWQ